MKEYHCRVRVRRKRGSGKVESQHLTTKLALVLLSTAIRGQILAVSLLVFLKRQEVGWGKDRSREMKGGDDNRGARSRARKSRAISWDHCVSQAVKQDINGKRNRLIPALDLDSLHQARLG